MSVRFQSSASTDARPLGHNGGVRVSWDAAVPRLRNRLATLREISVRDAATLLPHIADPGVIQHLAPCPATIAGLERFARWAQQKRRRGQLICLAIVPAGQAQAVGVIQVWPLDPSGSTAEWGVVIGRTFWGTGLFPAAASMLFQFVFESLEVVRLEARTTLLNRRANAALHKVGAINEGTLRSRRAARDRATNHLLWSIPESSIRLAWRIARNESGWTR